MSQPDGPIRASAGPALANRVLRVLLTNAAVLLVMHVISRVIAWNIPLSTNWLHFVDAFDLDTEHSVPTWFSLFQLFAAAAVATVIAVGERRAGERRWWEWAAVSTVLVYISLDEQVRIHEYTVAPLRSRLGIGEGPFYIAWVVVGIVAVVVVALILSRFALRLQPAVRWRLIAAATMFVAGSVGVEMLYSQFVLGTAGEQRAWLDALFHGAEETLEITGVAVAIWAMLHHDLRQEY